MGPLQVASGTTAAPTSISYVGKRTGSFTTQGNIIIDNSLTNSIQYNNSANQIQLYMGGNTINPTVSDSAFHAVQAIVPASGNATVNVDNTSTTGTTGGGGWEMGGIVGSRNGTNPLTAEITELGVALSTTFTSGNMTSLCHNQYEYWGTSVSC
jgi:hypothetical protein